MRAILIVNPHATSTKQLRRDVITRALASELDLEVVQTQYRGHACSFAADAAKAGYDLVLTLGGDGTVNEAVNGLLSAHPPRPALAAIPGGSANVFPRALGLPTDPVDATGQILAALPAHRYRTINVGLAGEPGRAGDLGESRYFTFNAGLGFDAEVVRAVEGMRADGQAATAGRYLWTAIRHFYGVTNRRQPALTLERDGKLIDGRLFFAIVSNAAPWTYLGQRAVNPCPDADFGNGLDIFALRSLSTLHTVNTLRQMLSASPPRAGKHIVSLHDERSFTIRAARPIAFQVDGEYMGERECVTFRSVTDALQVIA